jgi:methyltransferase (TIGR00027 family)
VNQSERKPEAQGELQPEPLIRNISDTARWVAVYRARETERPDAVFRDPLARRLAGERGEQIANSMPLGGNTSWPMVARTYLIDELISAEIARGADMVINLAAGLDTRPYRLPLPLSLQWIEVDLPEILSHKEEILRGEKPVCVLERIRLNLADVAARREIFERLGRRAKKALVITEGLITYLGAEEVAGLAQDLAARPSFESWILDLTSPALLRTLQKRQASNLKQAAPFKFAPEEGARFFVKYGWNAVEVRSLLKTAARIHRLPLFLLPFSWLPETEASRRTRPWSGVCLFKKPQS